MDSFPLDGISISASDDLNNLIVIPRGTKQHKFSLSGSRGITLKTTKGKLQVLQNNPVSIKRFQSNFFINRSNIRVRINFIQEPERNVIVITDFDETIEATNSSTINTDANYLQIRKKGSNFEVFAGVPRVLPPVEPDDDDDVVS